MATDKFTASLLPLLALITMIAPPAVQAADLEKGKAIFAERCASCHGTLGAGDGPVALALPPELKPRNLQEGQFKAAKDDAMLKDLIIKGGVALGLNPLMPPQSGLSDDDLSNLIAFVRSLKK